MVGGQHDGGRRAEIVRAAFARVATEGFEGLRLRDVARDVGIDHTTIHHHIATKQQLVESVADLADAELRASGPRAANHRR